MYSAQQYSSTKGAFRHVQNTAQGLDKHKEVL